MLNDESPISSLLNSDDNLSFNEKQINKLLLNDDAEDSDGFQDELDLNFINLERDSLTTKINSKDDQDEIANKDLNRNSSNFNSKTNSMII